MRPLVMSRTPLRVSFFGGGTDLPGYYRQHGGRVLSFAIDKYVYVTVKSSWDDGLVLNCGEPQRARTLDEVTHDRVREALRLTGYTGGLEIVSLSDIPTSGSGLGSSSAFTVGILHALYAHQGETRSVTELAELACHIEIDRLGEPIGKQDQYASAVGGCQEYVFHPDGTVSVDAIEVSAECAEELGRHALMFYTGRTRQAAQVLADQQARIDTTMEHLHALKELVSAGRRCLAESDIARLGMLLHAGWETKKKLSDRIHDDGINTAYQTARAAGAYGGKLLGAGGGGFLLFLCPPERHAAVRQALSGLRETPFRLGAQGTTLIVGDGRATRYSRLNERVAA
jgi:D-glycero-alpha-D-manno-heptose-7-phosphate kinase